MKTIQLTQGQAALVDDEDYQELSLYKWYTAKVGRTWYAQRKVQLNGKWVTVRMHRQILWLSYGDKLQVHHKNGNGPDNKREQFSVGNPAADVATRALLAPFAIESLNGAAHPSEAGDDVTRSE
jgi:hypothetical protein